MSRLKLLAGLILLLSPILLRAQNLFNRTYGAYGAFNQGAAAVQTSDEGYLILGSTGGWESQNGDMVVIKTDSLGIQQWAKLFGSEYSDQAVDMIRLSNGDALLCGNSASGLDGDYDLRLIRIDESGELIWDISTGSAEWDFFTGAAELSNGSIAISAQTFGGPSSAGNMQLLCIDADGNELWNQILPGEAAQRAGGLCVLQGDTIILVGSQFNTTNNSNDYIMSWWDASGALLNQRSHAFAEDDHLVNVMPIPGGDLFVVGNTRLSEEQFQCKIHRMDRVSGDILTTFSFSSDPGLSFEVRDVDYVADVNAFVLAINYKDNSLFRAAAFKFTPDPILQCTFVYPGADNSSVSTIVVANDGFGFVATSNEFAPGQTSIALSKADFDCNNVPVQVGFNAIAATADMPLAFPNPSSTGIFSLVTPKQAVLLKLMNADGRILYSTQTAAEQVELNLTDKADGLYRILYFDNTGKLVGQTPIIKQ